MIQEMVAATEIRMDENRNSGNQELRESIIYARRIQQGMMLKKRHLQRLFEQSFIIFEPKDVVSGDFYWFSRIGQQVVVAVCDCTGHGIPGAFMSVLGISLLNQLVIEEGQTDPSLILQRLDHKLHKAFSYSSDLAEGEHNADGMDIAITVIDTEKQQFQFASAMRPVYHVHKGELKEIKGSRYPIGGRNPGFTKYFPSITVNYASGDRLFLCSDGYADQFGGPFEKKFMTRQLKRLLQDLASCDMQEAEKRLVQGFNDWKGRHPQTDDLLMIGLHL